VIGADRRSAFVVALFFVLSRSQHTEACTYSSNPTKVGRTFLVEVLDRGRPVGGLQIELSTNPGTGNTTSHKVSIVTTDTNGLARFAAIRPRLYYLGIKHAAFPSSIEINVLRVAPKETGKIIFDWPGVKPVSVQYLSGSLKGYARTERGFGQDLLHPLYRPVVDAKLTLSKAISNEVVESLTTRDSGTFTFGPLPVGLYLLRVESANDGDIRWVYPANGYIPIEIDTTAKLTGVNLFLDQAICGELGYENREEKTPIDATTK